MSYENERNYGAGHETRPSEIVSQYQEVLRGINVGHDQGMLVIAQIYGGGVDQLFEGKEPSIGEISSLVSSPRREINKLTDVTALDLTAAVRTAAQECPKDLFGDDRKLLAQAFSKARNVDLGVGFWQIEDIINRASSQEAISIMRASLDNFIWKAAQVKTQRVDLGTGFWQVEEVIENASSPEARAAMRSALDKNIWAQAQVKASRVDLGSGGFWQVEDVIHEASSPKSVQALRAGINQDIWVQAQATARRVNLETGGWRIGDVLDNISNQKLRNIMESAIMQKAASRQRQTRSEQRYTYSAPDLDDLDRMFRETTDFDRERIFSNEIFEKMFEQAFGRSSSRSGQQNNQQRRTTPPRQERPRPQEKRPPRYQEVDNIVRQAISRDSSGRWLANTDKEPIQRVVNSVKVLRKQAKDKGEEITDRQIYIKYRRKIETDSIDEDTKKRLTYSTQILLALMGGKVDGKLPF